MQAGYRGAGRHVVVSVHREGAGRFVVGVDGQTQAVEAKLVDPAAVLLRIGEVIDTAYVVRVGGAIHVWIAGEVHVLTPESAAAGIDHRAHRPPTIVAPMPGKVLQVLVVSGQKVGAGDGLVIVEAMKMEHRITAEGDAVVRAVHVAGGQMVDGGAILVELEYV